MNFFGDYHTHSIYSRRKYIPINHAKGTLEENVLAAKIKGLKEVGISDHGFSHRMFGCERKKLKEIKSELNRLSQKYQIKTYLGVEANFISLDGTIDVTDDDRKMLDIVLCGFHSSAKPKTFKEQFTIFFPNFFAKFFGTSKKLKEKNTIMVLNALEKNTIDVLTHLNRKMKCNVFEIAKKAAEKGTLIELNEKKCDFSKEEINLILEAGANFIVNSDSHKPKSIGDFKNVEKIIIENNIPIERIANLNKTPKFISLTNKNITKEE